MLLTRQIALRPTEEQATLLAKNAGACRWVWNFAVSEANKVRKHNNELRDRGVPKDQWKKYPKEKDLRSMIFELRKKPAEEGGCSFITEVSSWSWQEGINRYFKALDRTFKSKVGDKYLVGFPKLHKKRQGFGSFTAYSFLTVTEDTIQIAKVGHIRLMPGSKNYIPPGKYKSVSVSQRHGKWYASICYELTETPSVPDDVPRVGLDLGVRKIASLSDGSVIENPRHLKKSAQKLKHLHKEFSRKKKKHKKGTPYSNRAQKAKKKLSSAYEDVANQREDYLHKTTTTLADKYPVIVMEDLKVKNMTKRSKKGKPKRAKAGLNKAILDVSFYEFKRQLQYKQALRGHKVILVNPAYTSQICHKCLEKTNCGSNEVFTCSACGFSGDRDLNAAHNILARSYEVAEATETRPSKIVAAEFSETKNEHGVSIRLIPEEKSQCGKPDMMKCLSTKDRQTCLF